MNPDPKIPGRAITIRKSPATIKNHVSMKSYSKAPPIPPSAKADSVRTCNINFGTAVSRERPGSITDDRPIPMSVAIPDTCVVRTRDLEMRLVTAF